MSLAHGDLLFTGDDRVENRAIQRQAADDRLRRVAPGIYAQANGRPLEEIVCGGWAPILARYAPGAVLQGRSAARGAAWRERGPDQRMVFPGWIFATSPGSRTRGSYSLPGLEIRTIPGVGPLEGDLPYLGVHLPSDARMLLENLEPSRSRDGPSRTLGREGVEERVEALLKTVHEDGLRSIRARAERIAPQLGAEDRLGELLDIIGAVAGTRQVALASRSVGARRRRTDPYDPECLDRLKLLGETLGRLPTDLQVPDPHTSPDARVCTSFMEAYFTNYIEGTRFLVDKARRIVFDAEEADGRPEDGRDVTQTFAQVSALAPEAPRSNSVAEFIDEIRARNRALMDARPEKRPGEFKVEANAAGNTTFVLPDLVRGTLREGFRMLEGLEDPFARGVFVHTLLVMVHPFDDGNGRTSRIMMTKELVAGGRSRIVVPTIYRSDYIGGLRALSAHGAPQAAPLVRAMLRCQAVTARIVSEDLDRTVDLWASTHAFLEDERGAKLTAPDPDVRIVWRNGLPAPEAYWNEVDLEATLNDDTASIMGFRSR